MPVDRGRRSILLQRPQLPFVQVNFYQVVTMRSSAFTTPQSQFKIKQSLLAGCAVQKELRIGGKKLLSQEGLDWAACAVACFHHPDCNYWTHHHVDGFPCELSSSDEQKIPAQSGSMTGQKACGKHGADFLASANLRYTSAQTNQSARVWPKANEKSTPEYQAIDQNTTGILKRTIKICKHLILQLSILCGTN